MQRCRQLVARQGDQLDRLAAEIDRQDRHLQALEEHCRQIASQRSAGAANKSRD